MMRSLGDTQPLTVELPGLLAWQLEHWWSAELLDAIDQRVDDEMVAARGNPEARMAWATIGGLATTVREVRGLVTASVPPAGSGASDG